MDTKASEVVRRRLGTSLAAAARQRIQPFIRLPPDLKSRIHLFLKNYSPHHIEQKLACVKAAIAKCKNQELASNPQLKNQFEHGKKALQSPYAKRMTLSMKQRPEYGEEETAGYIASLMPASYASLYQVLSEVRRRLPNFKPARVLDFGSGPGTSIWALGEVWPGIVQRAHLVEISQDMADACTTLLQGMKNSPEINTYEDLRQVRTRVQGESLKHDLVICSHSLGELPTMFHRMVALRSLWSLTRDTLVILEPGTPHGSNLVRWCRSRVLMWEAKKVRSSNEGLFLSKAKRTMAHEDSEWQDGTKPQGVFVVSPCAHDGVCPMDKTGEYCYFSSEFEQIQDIKLANQGYSYVILRRGARLQSTWPLDEASESLTDVKPGEATDVDMRKHEFHRVNSANFSGGWARIVDHHINKC